MKLWWFAKNGSRYKNVYVLRENKRFVFFSSFCFYVPLIERQDKCLYYAWRECLCDCELIRNASPFFSYKSENYLL